MLNLACKHKEFLARGYENNIKSYPKKRRSLNQLCNGAAAREMKETELHAEPIEVSVRTH